MALTESAVSELLEAFRAGQGVDLIRESVRMVLQSQCDAYNRVMPEGERRLLKAVELWPQEQQVNASPLLATCSQCRRLGRRPDIPPSTASSVPVNEAACGLAR
jgi:hypothetical protein